MKCGKSHGTKASCILPKGHGGIHKFKSTDYDKAYPKIDSTKKRRPSSGLGWW